jgi:hypothetical protein
MVIVQLAREIDRAGHAFAAMSSAVYRPENWSMALVDLRRVAPGT